MTICADQNIFALKGLRRIRLTQDLGCALGSYKTFLESYQLTRADINPHSPPISSLTLNAWTRLVALEASFLRREHPTPQLSDELLAHPDLEEISDIHLQRGLNHLSQDRKQDALRHFKLASSTAEDVIETLFSHYNVLICLEDFGLSHHGFLETFESAIEAASPEEKNSILPLYRSYQARMSFRFKDIDSIQKLSAAELNQQGLFLCAFALSAESILDSRHVTLRDAIIEKYASQPPRSNDYAFITQLNTLLGRMESHTVSSLHPREFRSHHFAERLYLWVWRWMRSKDSSLLMAIRKLLENARDAEYQFSEDDKQQIQCALGWLSLLGLKPEMLKGSRWADQMDLLQIHERTFPRYREEMRMILDLKAGCVEWNNSPLSFFVRGIFESLCMKKPSAGIYDKVEVDLLESSLNLPTSSPMTRPTERGVKKILPREMTRALYSLATDDSLNLAYFYTRVWGKTVNLENRHVDRIVALIRKINDQMDPYFQLGLKAGCIVVKSRSRSLVFVNEHVLVQNFMDVFADFCLGQERANEAADDSHDRKKKIHPTGSKGAWSRHDFEKLWGLSKTATVVKIQSLVSLGALSKMGVGKATSYRIEREDLLGAVN